MQFSVTEPKFSGRSERTNPDLNNFESGDQVVLVQEKSTGRSGPRIQKAEIVTIESIEPHHGRKVHGIKVPESSNNPNQPAVRKRVGEDQVDLVTFRYQNGATKTLLYGDYKVDFLNKTTDSVLYTKTFSMHKTGSDSKPYCPVDESLHVIYGRPFPVKSLTLKSIPDYVAESTAQINEANDEAITAAKGLQSAQHKSNELLSELRKLLTGLTKTAD